MIHICFHKNLIHYIYKYCPHDQVIYFPLKLSIGMIPRTTYAEEIDIYQMKKENIEKELNSFYQMIQNDDIYAIWYSHESDEYCGFLYVLFDILKFSDKIFLYNCSQKIVNASYSIVYDSSNEIPEDIFLWLINHPQKIDHLHNLSSLYQQLFDKKFDIRRYHHGLIFTTMNEIENEIIYLLEKKPLSMNALKLKLIVDEEMNLSEEIINFIIKHMAEQKMIYQKDDLLLLTQT